MFGGYTQSVLFSSKEIWNLREMNGARKYYKWENPRLGIQRPNVLSHMWIQASNFYTRTFLWEWRNIEIMKLVRGP